MLLTYFKTLPVKNQCMDLQCMRCSVELPHLYTQVPISNLAWVTGLSYGDLSWYSSVSPGKYQINASKLSTATCLHIPIRHLTLTPSHLKLI